MSLKLKQLIYNDKQIYIKKRSSLYYRDCFAYFYAKKVTVDKLEEFQVSL